MLLQWLRRWTANFDRAAVTFRKQFPRGGLTRCDFRPDFDGYWVNASSEIEPSHNEASTRQAAIQLLTEIAAWLQQHSHQFGPEDKLQLIVGFSLSVKPAARQIFKCHLPASGLKQLVGVDFAAVGGNFRAMEGWQDGVTWREADRT